MHLTSGQVKQNFFKKTLLSACCAALLSTTLLTNTSRADDYPWPPKDIDLIGNMESVDASANDTLLDIARSHNLGLNAIVAANPSVDRWIPGGNKVILSKRHILPDAPRKGIVVNIAEMRLYYYFRGNDKKTPQIITHPISIGRLDWDTPLGKTSIVKKVKNPVWRPPASIKKEHAADGDILPDVVPAGPDNPLGLYAMRLAIPGYLIHSTNKPFGIGMQVTHGCIRMYPEDIEPLFQKVKEGEEVMLVNQPVKFGWLMDNLYIEVHPSLDDTNVDPGSDAGHLLEMAFELIEKHGGGLGQDIVLDGSAMKAALEAKNGTPTLITRIR